MPAIGECHPGDVVTIADPETGERHVCVVAWQGGRKSVPAIRVCGRWFGIETVTHPITVPRDTEVEKR